MSVLATVPFTAPSAPLPTPRRRGRPPKAKPAVTFQPAVPTQTPDVVALLPLVGKIASWFERRYNLPAGWEHDELVAEGVIGLMRAIKKYDASRPCSLETYAGYWIRGVIWRALKARWTDLNHEAPPPDDEMEGPWPLPERAVLCREVVDFVSDLGIAEQVLVYGRVDEETYASLAKELGLTISAAVRWHTRALKRVRRAAGIPVHGTKEEAA